MKLEAPEVIYDMNTSIGQYNSDGKVTSEESVITSQKALITTKLLISF